MRPILEMPVDEMSTEFLRQGPVLEKNQAHRDIERILYNIMDLDYPDQLPEEAQRSSSEAVGISRNSLGQVLVTCRNGKTYNLSCALRNANLDYFRLLPKHIDLLNAIQRLLKPSDVLQESKNLIGFSKKTRKLTAFGSDAVPIDEIESVPIYEIEEDAIKLYTSNTYYKKMNALLRGTDVWTDERNARKKIADNEILIIILNALLAISGINKNVDDSEQPLSPKTLTRFVQRMPMGLGSEMFVGGLQRTDGLLSFSEDDKALKFKYLSIKIQMPNSQDKKSIQAVSEHPEEKEMLFSPNHLFFRGVEVDKQNKLTFNAVLMHGLVTVTTDHYLSEWALSVAYENHLQHPYKDGDCGTRYNIHRPNHALAHHARVVSYAKPVIDYFKKYATDEFQAFCAKLTPYDIEIIKVVLAFLRTGRESERSFEDPRYLEYTNASCANMKKFMRDHLSMSDEDIAPYVTMVKNFAIPNYATITSDDTDESKKIKFSCHIIRFTHELDIPRCVSRPAFMRAIQAYQESPLIVPSSEQNIVFNQLEKLALLTIVETGDRLALGYSQEYVEKPDEFKACNTNVFYVLDRCKFALNMIHTPPDRRSHLRGLDNLVQYESIIKIKNYYALGSFSNVANFCETMSPLSETVQHEIFNYIEKRIATIESAKIFLEILQPNMDHNVKTFLTTLFLAIPQIDIRHKIKLFLTITQYQFNISYQDLTIPDDQKQMLKAAEELLAEVHDIGNIRLLLQDPLNKMDDDKQAVICGIVLYKYSQLMLEDFKILKELLGIREWCEKNRAIIRAEFLSAFHHRKFKLGFDDAKQLLEINGWAENEKDQILEMARNISISEQLAELFSMTEWTNNQKLQIARIFFQSCVQRLDVEISEAHFNHVFCAVFHTKEAVSNPHYSIELKSFFIKVFFNVYITGVHDFNAYTTGEFNLSLEEKEAFFDVVDEYRDEWVEGFYKAELFLKNNQLPDDRVDSMCQFLIRNLKKFDDREKSERGWIYGKIERVLNVSRWKMSHRKQIICSILQQHLKSKDELKEIFRVSRLSQIEKNEIDEFLQSDQTDSLCEDDNGTLQKQALIDDKVAYPLLTSSVVLCGQGKGTVALPALSEKVELTRK